MLWSIVGVIPKDAAEFLCLKIFERRIGFSPGMLLLWPGRLEERFKKSLKVASTHPGPQKLENTTEREN